MTSLILDTAQPWQTDLVLKSILISRSKFKLNLETHGNNQIYDCVASYVGFWTHVPPQHSNYAARYTLLRARVSLRCSVGLNRKASCLVCGRNPRFYASLILSKISRGCIEDVSRMRMVYWRCGEPQGLFLWRSNWIQSTLDGRC